MNSIYFRKFSGSFQFFIGNIDYDDSTIDKGPDYQYGWSELKNKTDIEEYFPISKSISDLTYRATMLYMDENRIKHYITLKPKILRFSYPLGSCLRYFIF